jgi:hypothetical protein
MCGINLYVEIRVQISVSLLYINSSSNLKSSSKKYSSLLFLILMYLSLIDLYKTLSCFSLLAIANIIKRLADMKKMMVKFPYIGLGSSKCMPFFLSEEKIEFISAGKSGISSSFLPLSTLIVFIPSSLHAQLSKHFITSKFFP